MDQKYIDFWSCGILDMFCGLANFRLFLPCTITYETGQDKKSKLSKRDVDVFEAGLRQREAKQVV
jgi:hypothetical protein